MDNTITYWLVITKFDYLKTPQFSVTQHNSVGGSFSNSGSLKSLKMAARHIKACYGHMPVNTRVLIETVHGYDETETAIVTTDTTDIDALLSKTGISRGL